MEFTLPSEYGIVESDRREFTEVNRDMCDELNLQQRKEKRKKEKLALFSFVGADSMEYSH